ncbi:hypothetical protein AB1N83_007083 [Pleurotus pulmonarius]
MDADKSLKLRDAYDSKIDAYLAAVRLLREQRNADCSQTRALPTEILSKIFGVLVHHFNSQGERYPHIKWMAVTHVCRSWRTLAFNEPTLWTDLTSVHRKFFPDIFARTQTAPLILNYDHLQYPDTLRLISDHIVEYPERMKKLSLCFKAPPLSLLNKPAPFLESLVIYPHEEFPPDFLGGAAPRLQSLICNGKLPLEAKWLAAVTKLDCRVVHLESTWLSNLTSLRFHPCWIPLDAIKGGTRLISMEILLSALEKMPLLQCLDLNFPHEMDLRTCERLNPVYLRDLRDLTVHFRSKPQMSSIFNHLKVDGLERLTTSWAGYAEPALFEPACRFFGANYHGDGLQYWRRAKDAVEIYRTWDPSAEASPVLVFESDHLDHLARISSLLPQSSPRIFQAGNTELLKCDTIEELHITSSTALSALFDLGDAFATIYPSLRLLRLEGFKFKARVLKDWLLEQSSSVQLFVKNCGLSAKDSESLQALRGVHCPSTRG